MVHYWFERYSDAIASANGAKNPSVRSAYSQLADHYLSMIRFSGGRMQAEQIPAPRRAFTDGRGTTDDIFRIYSNGSASL